MSEQKTAEQIVDDLIARTVQLAPSIPQDEDYGEGLEAQCTPCSNPGLRGRLPRRRDRDS